MHNPLDTPTEDMFTEEQLHTLSFVSSEFPVRQEFAQILYYLDISVRARPVATLLFVSQIC